MLGWKILLGVSVAALVYPSQARPNARHNDFGVHRGNKRTAESARLPMFTVTGSYRDVGHAVGTHFSDRIGTFYKTYENREKVLEFAKTAAGQQMVKTYQENVEHRLPHIWQELNGLAEGSGQPLEEVFLYNMLDEINLYLHDQAVMTSPLTSACSDIFLHTDSRLVNGHNEDNTKSSYNTSYLIHATITAENTSAVLEDFTAFCYPGILCGSAFGFNNNGVTFTFNSLPGKSVEVTDKLPRNFIGRAMLALDSISAVLHQVLPTKDQAVAQWQTGCSFSLNLGSRDPAQIINLEIAPDGVSVLNVTNGYYHHFNMYQHMSRSQFLDESSVHREDRFMQMLGPSLDADIVRILGDTEDKEYPIFRNGAPPDNSLTIATALFDLIEGHLSIYLGNPRTSQASYMLSIPKKKKKHNQ